MNTIIIPKHATNVNKAIAWNTKYDMLSNERDVVDGKYEFPEETTEWKRINRKCENAYDKYCTYIDELPKYLQKLVEKGQYI